MIAEIPSVPIWLWTNNVEPKALAQLKNIAALPWAFHHVAVMPDVHYGKGATVGSVIAMKGALAPAAVGVDIGCGMGAIRTSLTASDLPDSLRQLRLAIEEMIPVGFKQHDEPVGHVTNLGIFNSAIYEKLHPYAQNIKGKALRQLGTLGGGNHFIELCLDTSQRVWLMLHSGSRNIGKVLAEIHIAIARELAHNAPLPDRDLSVFLANTPEMTAYRRDLMWAQSYAYINRATMFDLYVKALRNFFPAMEISPPIMCHHNYVSEEIHFGEEVLVTRKGAIRARSHELGIIPGSMGTKSYIVRGLGNPESFSSASHGAGRCMSRGEAKRAFSVEDLVEQTSGVECRKDDDVIDEIPGAYKKIEEVMANQVDLVTIVEELKQVLCVKG